jgi:pimeloyl-ACP methyl ester carboxylesterase
MDKLAIKNRKNQKIVVLVDVIANKSKGLVFIMHGLGGTKDQPHMKVMASSFKDAGYNVVSFDSTNSLGESDGNLEDATTTNYYEDLEDVLSWSSKQKWYVEPFILAGHSLGAMSCALYSQKYPNKVKALAPISTVVSWTLSRQTKSPEDLGDWKKKGVREWTSNSGKIKRLKWNFVEDRMKYDLLKNIDKLTMPILLVVGQLDTSTPVEHQQYFYERLPGDKEIHIIPGSEHTFRKENELKELKKYLDSWIKKL